MDGPKHWHGSIEHIVYTAIGTVVVIQVVRHLAGMAVTSGNGTVSALGKAVGGIFSFPAQ